MLVCKCRFRAGRTHSWDGLKKYRIHKFDFANAGSLIDPTVPVSTR
jgi:hypothetical protein